MDPLTITTSVITLISLGRGLSKGLLVLRDLSHVPQEITALIEEVNDLNTTLAAVGVATNQRSKIVADDDVSENLHRLLVKAKDLLTVIANYCGMINTPEGDASSSKGPSQVDLLSRFRWIKDRKAVDQYRRKLRIVRLDIASSLLTLNLYVRSSNFIQKPINTNASVDTRSVLTEVRHLTVAVQKMSSDHESLSDMLASPRRDMIGSNPELPSAQPTEVGSSNSDFDKGRKDQLGSPEVHSNELALLIPDESPKALGLNCSPPTYRTGLSCMSSCSCACHRVSKIKTPVFSEALFGAMTIRVKGIPTISPACDEVTCEKRHSSSLTIRYRFPRWVCDRVMNSMLFAKHASGPQMNLTTTRIICRNSDIFWFSMQGDIEGVKKLFARGLASPYDATHNYGYTALHYATDCGHVELCDFLIKNGASRNILDFNDNSPTDLAYNKICSSDYDGRQQDRMLDLFEEEEWLEQKQYSMIHKAVLSLLKPSRSLQEVLQISSKAINQPDADGRTPLSWAADRGDTSAVALLLDYQAKHTIHDRDGNSALHWSVNAPKTDAMRLLLDAGADANHYNKHLQTPLIWAHKPASAELLLAQPHVDIDHMDAHGATAIGNAAFYDHPNMVEYLVKRGADVNKTQPGGATPLLDCISCNNSATCVALLWTAHASGLDLGYRDWLGESCLHYLARRAYPPTAAMFRDALRDGVVDVTGLDTADVGMDGLTPRDLLRLRGDAKVQAIMEAALQIIDREKALERSSESSTEGGFADAFEMLPTWEKDVGLKEAPVQAQVVAVDP